jgi:hypothetical protein
LTCVSPRVVTQVCKFRMGRRAARQDRYERGYRHSTSQTRRDSQRSKTHCSSEQLSGIPLKGAELSRLRKHYMRCPSLRAQRSNPAFSPYAGSDWRLFTGTDHIASTLKGTATTVRTIQSNENIIINSCNLPSININISPDQRISTIRVESYVKTVIDDFFDSNRLAWGPKRICSVVHGFPVFWITQYEISILQKWGPVFALVFSYNSHLSLNSGRPCPARARAGSPPPCAPGAARARCRD